MTVPSDPDHAPALTGTQATLADGFADTTYDVTAAQLLTGFTDADNDPLAVEGLTASANGTTATIADLGNGTYAITAPAGYTGPVSLSYEVSDGRGGVYAATESFTIDAAHHIVGTAGDDTLANDGYNDSIEGLAGDDSLIGGAGNDTLSGGDGNDTVTGGGGNDQLFGSEGNDSLTAGNDRTYLDGGDGSDTLTGGAGDDYIYDIYGGAQNLLSGNGGNDYLAGDGTLSGGDGNDTIGFFVGHTDASVQYLPTSVSGGAGDDSISSLFTGTHDLLAPNTLDGGDGNDTIVGSDDQDSILGDAGSDSLAGGAGNDTLDGGTGADTMYGGAGNDVYYVDNIHDVVSEETTPGTDDGGTDLVYSTVNFTLPDFVENLTLTANNVNGTGNALDNVIHGNNGNNVLLGLDGNDSLLGGGGNDSLDGGTGNDYLDGGSGNDALTGGAGNDTLMGSGAETMHGGSGNDTYYVSNAVTVVSEETTPGVDDGGHDIVYSAVASFTLGAFIEDLTLMAGAGSASGTGNSLDNDIHGNNFDNVLTGLDGNDSLLGGGGNDSLSGGSGNDYIDAGDGNDTLVGGAGNDTLIGGAGADQFVFAAAGSANGVDQVFDFVHGTDQLLFTGADYGFASGHVLGTAEFTTGSAAIGTSAQFVWNAATHTLYWDHDGAGGDAAVAIAIFHGTVTLSAADLHFT